MSTGALRRDNQFVLQQVIVHLAELQSGAKTSSTKDCFSDAYCLQIVLAHRVLDSSAKHLRFTRSSKTTLPKGISGAAPAGGDYTVIKRVAAQLTEVMEALCLRYVTCTAYVSRFAVHCYGNSAYTGTRAPHAQRHVCYM